MSRALIYDGTKWIASSERQARITRTTAQSIPNAAVTPVQFTTEAFDLPNNDQHDNVTNNNRLTCVEAGFYTVGASWTWSSVSGVGLRIAYIHHGAVAISVDRRAGNHIEGTLVGGTRLAVGDIVDLRVYQDSGVTGGLNLEPAALALWWVRNSA